MQCPYCNNNDTQVKDSVIRRRRFCGKCNARFTTFERIQSRELTVVKKNGEKRVFDRDKLIRSMSIAARKRPITAEQIEQLVTEVAKEIEGSGETSVPTNTIGQIAIEKLAVLDSVAYVRFASVYHDFRDVDDFITFISSMQPQLQKDVSNG
jgi:transcriptional repressor NrdR